METNNVTHFHIVLWIPICRSFYCTICNKWRKCLEACNKLICQNEENEWSRRTKGENEQAKCWRKIVITIELNSFVVHIDSILSLELILFFLHCFYLLSILFVVLYEVPYPAFYRSSLSVNFPIWNKFFFPRNNKW